LRLDNSAAAKWRSCPKEYEERYVQIYPGSDQIGIEAIHETDARDFGKRMHALLHEHRAVLRGTPLPKPFPTAHNQAVEREAQATFAAYLAHYPVEPFEIFETEKVQVVPLPDWCPKCLSRDTQMDAARRNEGVAWLVCVDCGVTFKGGRHELVVKLDAIVRNRWGELQVLDTKTQSRKSNNNDAEHWAARPQPALYIYAARILYPKEKVSDEIILDLVRRQSPTGLLGPEFHRDTPRRTPRQIDEAVADIVWVADRIEESQKSAFWPCFRDNCKKGNWRCDYFFLHNQPEEARVDLLRKFKPAEPYLEEV
jgi:hypothetical protein